MTAPPMYQQLMGEAYARLAPAVRRFHALQGHAVLRGRVRVAAPSGRAARLLAWCMGTPGVAQDGPLLFELQARPGLQRWERRFPLHTMVSTMRPAGAVLAEQLGPAVLFFELREDGGRLVMLLARMRFLGLPCPRWLLPVIIAREHGVGDRLHFEVQARLPGLGLVTDYSGYLDLGSQGLQAEDPEA